MKRSGRIRVFECGEKVDVGKESGIDCCAWVCHLRSARLDVGMEACCYSVE